MQLFLMRHGEAHYQALSDETRELSNTGKLATNRMGEWLTGYVDKFDLVCVSPYVRAQQSWALVATHFPTPTHCLTLDELTPNSSAELAVSLVDAYAQEYNAQRVLIVAHMPLLGSMVSEWVPSIPAPMFATSAITLISKEQSTAQVEWYSSVDRI